MTPSPIESDALLTLARICDIALFYDKDTVLTITSDDKSSSFTWSGSFSYENRILSMFRLFEWLLRLPENEHIFSLSFDNSDSEVSVSYPANEGRTIYRERFDSASLFDDTAWLSSLLGCDVSNQSDIEILCGLSRRAIHSAQSASLPYIKRDDDYIELDVNHPFVLLTRLRAFILLNNEIVWKTTLSEHRTDKTECFDTWTFLGRTLRQPIAQFYSWDESQDTYVIDPRFGTLAIQVYRRCNGVSGLSSLPMGSITDEISPSIKASASKSVKVALTGSIPSCEVQCLNDTLSDMLKNSGKTVELHVISSADAPNRDALLKAVQAYDIAFLLDPWLLYKQKGNKPQIRSLPTDIYEFSNKTIRNDVLHFSEQFMGQHMSSSSQISLDIDWLIHEYHRARNPDKHLYISTSLPTTNSVAALSCHMQETRMELSAPHRYITLLHCAFPRKQRPGEYDDDELPSFMFRLNRWYQMFEPNLDRYTLTEHNIPADKLLRSVICTLSVENGEWRVGMYCPHLDKQTRLWLTKRITSRIKYALDRDEYAGVARSYAMESIINLLSSASVSPAQLLLAQALKYNNNKEISVEYLDDAPDIENYEVKMHSYNNRCADIHLLRLLDYIGDIRYKTISLLIPPDGDYWAGAIRRLLVESESLLSRNEGFPPVMRDCFQRIGIQARTALRC